MRGTVIGSLVVAGCLASGLLVRADEGGGKTYQTKNMIKAGVGTPLQSGATLVRSRNGLDARIAATHLDPNAAYTVWWVVFNNPAACGGPCSPAKFGLPAVRASVFYAAGFVTGLSNTGNITAHMEAGALPEGIDIELGNGLEPGNGFSAEIHIVVRSHGGTLIGSVAQQIGSFNGGCNPTCANKQAAVFPPVQ